jgi:hypothetical protein
MLESGHFRERWKVFSMSFDLKMQHRTPNVTAFLQRDRNDGKIKMKLRKKEQ